MWAQGNSGLSRCFKHVLCPTGGNLWGVLWVGLGTETVQLGAAEILYRVGHARDTWPFPKIREPKFRPQNTLVPILGTPKKNTPNFGKPKSDLEVGYSAFGQSADGMENIDVFKPNWGTKPCMTIDFVSMLFR